MTLHLMVGLPCSGKTTLAKQLEQKYSALRLTLDDWHVQLFGQDLADNDHDNRHEIIEAIQWEVATRALIVLFCRSNTQSCTWTERNLSLC